jgi:cyclophilin family peptidyl-prolyl cis-trans isomerase
MARRLFLPAGVWIVFLVLLGLARPVSAQDPPPQDGPGESVATPADEPTNNADEGAVTEAAEPSPEQVRAAYEAKFAQWKEILKRLRTLRHDYQIADEADREALERQWEETMAQANLVFPELTSAALAAYQAAPNEDRELTVFLVKALEDLVARDQYAAAAALGTVLVENQCDAPEVYQETGNALFSLHEFERALELLDATERTGALDINIGALRGQVETYVKLWEQERATREKEAEADDLPRVRLTTTKGEIVVELFENEAPDTVGNFISLVNSGFYDGLTFHRVISGFMAQGGCPEGNGSGGPGYRIYDETDKPDARKHFRGSLSMAKTAAPHSGGSQFFITFRPTPQLNGVHTVFGRVIEGMEVADSLQRYEAGAEGSEAGPQPDRIIKAEVIRDRGHEYVPNKVE